MRKIIEATLLSLDGVIGDPHEWATDYFESETQKDALARLMASDAMLMGRRTYEIFEKLWSQRTGEYFDRINSMRKYVFSSTLDRAGWNNATTVSGDVVAETAKLKRQGGQDLVIYGHGQLGRTLLRHGLIDEIRLAIHPVIVGRGKQFFQEGEKMPLRLMSMSKSVTGGGFTFLRATRGVRSAAAGASIRPGALGARRDAVPVATLQRPKIVANQTSSQKVLLNV